MNAEKTAARSLKLLLLSVLLTVASAQFALGWNNVGHRGVAEVVWRQLSSHERREASALLAQHPHYDRLLAVDVPPGVSTNEWVFLTAAVWPDLVRHSKPGHPQKPHSITQYDLYPHAIGYPFMRPAQSNSVFIENFFIAEPNAEQVLSNSIITLKDRKKSAHDRAVSLCWTLHLGGDLHQPLHAATLVSPERTGWDGLGGNYIVIDPRGAPNEIDLHSFWDRLGGVDPSYKSIASLADRVTGKNGITARKLREYRTNKTIASWVQESFRLAVHVAYAENRVRFAHIHDLNSGKVPRTDIPVLTADYIRDAEAVAERRIGLAGERLTDILKRVW